MQKIDNTKVCDIVKDAGKLIMGLLKKKHSYTNKPDGSYATEADYQSEQFLKDNLGRLFPEFWFLGEETGQSGMGEYGWVIDPIDGTTNFAHGFPYFAINLALIYKNEPIVGITYNPVADELFVAEKNKGAFLNGKSINVSEETSIEKAFCSIAIPYRKVDYTVFDKITYKLEQSIYSFRKLGCASLDLASVACGRLDGAVLKYVKWWDIAAGIVLIREAGGLVSEFNGDGITQDFSSCLGSNSHLHGRFCELLAKSS